MQVYTRQSISSAAYSFYAEPFQNRNRFTRNATFAD